MTKKKRKNKVLTKKKKENAILTKKIKQPRSQPRMKIKF